jgi:predicted GNAT superfamily acetyltransferase
MRNSIDQLIFRRPQSPSEFDQLADLQKEIWGFDDLQVTPPDILQLHDYLGGVVQVAFQPDGKAIAFVYSFIAWENDRFHHWSHMLAVLPEYRGHGLGKILKIQQRDIILEQRLDYCGWTYCPLEGLNTRLNIVALGAVSFEYKENVYGESSGKIHGGLPTDRFIAHWDLDSDRAKAAAAGKPERITTDPADITKIMEISWRGDDPLPADYLLDLDEEIIACPILTNTLELKFRDNPLALEWRLKTRELFQHYFAAGYQVEDVLTPKEYGENLFLYLLRKR